MAVPHELRIHIAEEGPAGAAMAGSRCADGTSPRALVIAGGQQPNGISVVKALNTIRPASLASLGKPGGTARRAAIPVAGDDPAAKSVVLELANQMGFDGLDAGPLTESWRQQPGTPVYTTDLPLDAARQALADAARSRPPAGAANTHSTESRVQPCTQADAPACASS
jgi:hypothetical protein